VLNQQAQFAADMATMQARFDERFDKLTVKTDRLADALMGLTGIVGNLASQQQVTAQQLQETDRRQRETDKQLKELGDYIKSVEAQLNVVIEMFERHLREDHGKRPS
jgi:hypothetical protein